MKNTLDYYTREERNGVTLLSVVMFIFISFIFLQKYKVTPPSPISIQINSESSGQMAEHVSEDKNFSSKSKNIDLSIAANTDAKKFSKSISDSKTPSNHSIKNNNQKYGGALIDTTANPSNTGKSNYSKNSINKDDANSQVNSKKSAYANNYEKKSYTKKPYKKWKKKVSQPVGLNSSNPEEWQKLRGIGQVFSKRIIKFKDMLGGFHSKDQIREVYGMTDSLYQTIEPFIVIDTKYQAIDVNRIDVKKMASHPYLDWKSAKKIVAYRKQHGPYQSVESFKEIIGLNMEKLEKWFPYLIFSKDALASN